jgi:hypothetical protein
MTATIDPAEMKQLFPHPKLTKISDGTSVPTYEALTRLQEELFANTMAIPSVRGGGIYGHLILLHTPVEYALLEGAEDFELPDDPGPQPDFPNNANSAVVAQTTAVHKAEHAERKLYQAVEKAICQQIIEATPPMYLETLREKKFGLSRVTCRQMHTHLWNTYGEITPALLAANLAEMQAPWHPEQSPISTLYQRLNKSQDFADTGGGTDSGQPMGAHGSGNPEQDRPFQPRRQRLAGKEQSRQNKSKLC